MPQSSYKDLLDSYKTQASDPAVATTKAANKTLSDSQGSSGKTYAQLISEKRGAKAAPLLGDKPLGPNLPQAPASTPVQMTPQPNIPGYQQQPLSFGSSNSTQVLPSEEQVAKANEVADRAKGVVNKVRALKDEKNGPALRTVGSIADSAVNTGKDLVNKLDRFARADNGREFLLTGLDFGLNAYTLGAVDFITSAAPDVAGAAVETLGKATFDKNAKAKGEQARKDIQGAMEKVLQKGLYEGVGGFIANAAQSVLGEMSPAETESIKDIVTLGTMIAGFKAIEQVGSSRASMRAKEITSMNEAYPLLQPMADILGIELKVTPDGIIKLPDAESLKESYKKRLYEVASERSLSKKAEPIRTSGQVESLKPDTSKLSEPGIFETSSRKELSEAIKTKENAQIELDRSNDRLVDVDTEIKEKGGRSQAPTTLLIERADLLKARKAYAELIETLPSDKDIARPSDLPEKTQSVPGQTYAQGGDPLVQSKMDTIDTAYKMASDYQALGAKGFKQKWDPIVSRGVQVADAVTEKVRTKLDDFSQNKQAETIREVVDEPATRATRRKLQDLDEAGQLAFESEIVRMNDELNPKHVDDAGKQGYTFERKSDPTDRRPAYYDVEQNKVVFNEDMIRKSLDEIWKDNVIRVGEGKMTTVFRKKPGETFEMMKSRFEDTLLKHEVAHAETITPEDVAQMRAAREAGDTTKLEQLRSALEEKANKWNVERPERIPNDMASEVDSVIRRVEDKQFGRTQKEKLVVSQEVARASKREIRRMNRELSYKDKALRKKDIRLLRERITRRLEGQVLTEKFKKAEAVLKDKFNNKRLAQQTVVDFMRSAGVPKEVRAKFLVAIKNAATPEDAAGILKEVKKAWTEVERKKQIGKIKEMLDAVKPERRDSGVYAGKMDADTQRKVNEIGKTLEKSRNEINKEIVEKVDKFYAENPNATELSPELSGEIAQLELGGIKGQTLQQLRRTYDEIYSLIQNGKTTRELKLKRESMLREGMLQTIRNELTGSPNEKIELQPSKQVLDKIKGEGWLQTIYNDSGVLSSLARRVSSKMWSLAKDTVQRQSTADLAYVRRQKNFTGKMKEIYGGDWAQKFSEIIGKQEELGTMTDKNGKQVPVRATRGYAMDLYNLLKDQYAAKRLKSENGNALTDDMINKVLSILTPEDKALADYISSLYKEDHPGVAKAYADRNGVDLGYVEGYGGPLAFETAKKPDNTPTFVEELIQDSNIRKSGVSPKAIKSRNGYTGRLLVNSNPITKYLTYNRRINHYIEMGDVIKKWDSIISDPTIKSALADKYGASFTKSLEYQINNVTRGSLESIASPTAQKVAGLVSNVSQALIMNPRVVAGQFSAVTNFVAEAYSKKAFMQGVKNRKANIELLKKYAPAVEVRLSKTPSELMATLTSETTPISRAKQKVQEVLATPLEKADEVTTLLGASGLFEDRVQFYTQKGFDLEKSRQLAGRDVSEMVVRTQSGRSYLAKSSIENSSGMASVLTQLRNQPIKTTRGTIDMAKLYKEGRVTRKELASFLFWNDVIQPITYYSSRATANAAILGTAYVAAKAVGADKAADKFREKIKKERANFAKGNVFALVDNVVGGVPLVGDVVIAAARNILFKANQEIRPGVISALIDDIFSIGQQAVTGDFDESALLGLRAFLRSKGLSDYGAIELLRTAFAAGNEADKKEAKLSKNKSFDQKFAEKQARVQKKLDKINGK